MTRQHIALQVQNYFVRLVYPMGLNNGINLKLKLFTDNLFPHPENNYFLTFGCILTTQTVNIGNLPQATSHLELKLLGQRHHSSSSCQWWGR